ncbi:Hypothetical protein ADU72_1216 [Pediococcus damnosus]|uniref:Integral membrane protein n=2 Tax=Pediococcus damnosus TaxID=51663 RepID=A0ABN4N8X1_9LACO|nr:hypothetical protein [Pediococcus damnosus]AMV67149.1 Hypothetical protein ADU72_1216 [Pediococcus damnosus]KJU74839.1 hypothetical protein AH70_04515 [Pediococcus damnosus LMG 28219]PIO81072.1 hypothetical protein BSQ38_05120 [Pediococcus damnosus]PIO85437.1 hypothetical protein BSQ37_05580 [Pediococcus damnosus]PJE49470.1 hypothetical protein BSQ36_05770 [Pediococcus damnosus]
MHMRLLNFRTLLLSLLTASLIVMAIPGGNPGKTNDLLRMVSFGLIALAMIVALISYYQDTQI